MSKPMEEAKPPAEEHKGHDMKNMNAMPGVKKTHDMKDMSETEKARDMKGDGGNSTNHAAVAQKLIDPVCGMEASGEEDLSDTYNGQKYYFCSESDMEKFRTDPGKYVK